MEWRTVPGMSHIEVSDEAGVRTKSYEVSRKSRWGSVCNYKFAARKITPHTSSNGYLRVSIQRNNKRGPLYVHRLVALAFVNGHEPGHQVNHINGNKTDNRPSNLEWVPIDKNIKHAWSTGLYKNSSGERHHSAKLTAKRVRAIRRLLSAGATINTVAIACGVSPNTIWKIASGIAWQSVATE